MQYASAAAPAAEYPPVYRSLMAVGLLGSSYGQHEDADVIDTAITATLDDPTHYRVNRAMAQSQGGASKEAVESLRAHVQADPHDDGAKIALAVTMRLAGDDGWEDVIENVLASSADPAVREAARNVVAYLSQGG
jgi:thioredoxin-like negative regulator of GroEL